MLIYNALCLTCACHILWQRLISNLNVKWLQAKANSSLQVRPRRFTRLAPCCCHCHGNSKCCCNSNSNCHCHWHWHCHWPCHSCWHVKCVVYGCTAERQSLIRTLHIEFPFVATAEVAKLLRVAHRELQVASCALQQQQHHIACFP